MDMGQVLSVLLILNMGLTKKFCGLVTVKSIKQEFILGQGTIFWWMVGASISTNV